MALICVIALIAFSVLSMFSAKYRQLSRTAFDCVFRRLTLRPCESHFDSKMKAKIVVPLMRLSPLFAKPLNKHFELFSWLLVITLTVSGVLAAQGLYNYFAYGNCNGLNSSAFCLFNAIHQVSYNATHVEIKNCTCVGGETTCFTQLELYTPCANGNCT